MDPCANRALPILVTTVEVLKMRTYRLNAWCARDAWKSIAQLQLRGKPSHDFANGKAYETAKSEHDSPRHPYMWR
jgi:hypothetical protein